MPSDCVCASAWRLTSTKLEDRAAHRSNSAQDEYKRGNLPGARVRSTRAGDTTTSAYVSRDAPLVPARSEAAASEISQRRNEHVAAAEAERQQLALDVAALEEECEVNPTLDLETLNATVESYIMVDGRNGRNGLGLAFSRLEIATYDASLELAAGGIDIELAAPGTQIDQMCFMLGDEDSVTEDIHSIYRRYYATAVKEEARTGVPTIEHFRSLAWSSHNGSRVPFAVQLMMAAGATVKDGKWGPQHVEALESVMEFATCLNDGLSTESSVCFVIRAVDHAAGREAAAGAVRGAVRGSARGAEAGRDQGRRADAVLRPRTRSLTDRCNGR